MTRIIATEIAQPGYSSSQTEVREAIEKWLGGRVLQPARILEIFAHAGVNRRRSVIPLEEVFANHSFSRRNRTYCEASIELSLRAVRSVLELARVDPRQIALITTVSCTGFMIPSVDAHLANLLPLAPDIRRLPITELGCAAGAMALSHTADYLTARPEDSALVVSVELSSLNFQTDNLSMAHLISCALFGDGAAAVLMAGEDAKITKARASAPRVVATQTRFFYDTLEYMGFRLEETGFHLILDRAIPALVEDQAAAIIDEFLKTQDLSLADIDHFLVHPGGRRIVEALETALGCGPEALRISRQALAEYGNLSSSTVLYILRDFTRAETAQPGDRALLMAFGPGFNAEMLLLEWPA